VPYDNALDADVVCGVAVLEDRLYVVCERSSVISVFDAKTYKRLDNIKVSEMDDPNDIVACTITSQLYVADCRQ